MKLFFKVSSLLFILLTSTSYAQNALPETEAQKTLQALQTMGLSATGSMVIPAQRNILTDDGQMTEEMAVIISHPEAPFIYEASDLILYEGGGKQKLVMTYEAGSTRKEIVKKTTIFEVNTDATRAIAAVVKAFGKASDQTLATVKITGYSLRHLSCRQPGKKTECLLDR